MNLRCFVKHDWGDWRNRTVPVPVRQHGSPSKIRPLEKTQVHFRTCNRCGMVQMRRS